LFFDLLLTYGICEPQLGGYNAIRLSRYRNCFFSSWVSKVTFNNHHDVNLR